MNPKLRNTIKQVGRFVPVRVLKRFSYPPLLPFYHAVSDEKLPYVLNYPYRSVADFEKELDFLLKNYKPVELPELLKPEIRRQKVFHLSFDDGLRSCYDVVAPILLKKGIPATFFLNTAFVDNRNLFHRYKASFIADNLENVQYGNNLLKQYGFNAASLLQISKSQEYILDEMALRLEIDWYDFLQKYRPYLTTNQVQELAGTGFTLGAHSVNHPEFWLIPPQEQLKQIEKSMEWLQPFRQEIKAFAFPFTDDGVSSEVFRKIYDEKICDVTFGTAGLKYDSLEHHFQRFPCEATAPLPIALKNEMAYCTLRRLSGRNVVEHGNERIMNYE